MTRKILKAGIALSAATAAVGAGLYMLSEYVDQQSRKGIECCWDEEATPQSLSSEIGIKFPEGATDKRAALLASSRVDTGILAFTTSKSTADEYLGKLFPKDVQMTPNINPRPDSGNSVVPFEHIGLVEPETLKSDLRSAGLCPEDTYTPEGRHLEKCVDVFVHDFKPGHARIFIRSVISG